jgi:hypothetical protein
MYVHPAIAELECTSRLDVVDGLHKPLGHRLMKERQEARYKIANGAGPSQRFARARDLEREGEEGCARFSTKSFRPASRSSVGVSAGSQPSTVLDSEDDGGSARRDRAKAGRVLESGVGGWTRW